MRRGYVICLVGMFGAGILASWGLQEYWLRHAKQPPITETSGRSPTGAPPLIGVEKSRAASTVDTPLVPSAPELTHQERYDAALLTALDLLAEDKYAEALRSFETARKIMDTEQIRREIDRVQQFLDQQAAGERTTRDIQAVLDAGREQEAARLVTEAISQYGQTGAGPKLLLLKRQTDAMVTSQFDDRRDRAEHFRREIERAKQANDLRASALALEQLLQVENHPHWQHEWETARAALVKYEDCLVRAAELRRDPYTLEEAIHALQEARQAWNTPAVNQELEEYQLALQKRRDRLAVAEFDVRGGSDEGGLGRSVADELLPAFKTKYDLVERTRLGNVLKELSLQNSDLTLSDSGRQQVGRLAKARYLVVGSVNQTTGYTINARLLEIPTGLVVQTARIVAPDREELSARLPQVAHLLMMSDEQKAAYEELAARQARPRVVVTTPPSATVFAISPPPPVPNAELPAPPPVVVFSSRPLDIAGLTPEEMEQTVTPIPVVAEQEESLKLRLLQVTIKLGDNLFQRRRFREANIHFELARTLAPHREEIQTRCQQCSSASPKIPVVVVPPRPRLAVLDFVVRGDRLTPAMGACAAENLAPYFAPPYEVVDRGELGWYIEEMGLNLRELHTNPVARRWLGRALGARALVFGSLRGNRDLSVTARLVDTESGAELGQGKVRVNDVHCLRHALPELARMTLLDPAERAHLEKQAAAYQAFLVEGRQHFQRGGFTDAVAVYERARQIRPESVEVRALLAEARDQAKHAEWEEARRRDWLQQQSALAARQRQQQQLVREVEAARQRAEKEAAARATAERRLEEERRLRAYEQLVQQARANAQQKNFVQAQQIFESALALKRTEALERELALMREKVKEAEKRHAAEEKLARETAYRLNREEELRRTRDKLREEQRKREAADLARRKAQEERDIAEHARLVAEARANLQRQQFDAAINDLLAANRLRVSKDSEGLLQQVLDAKTDAAKQARLLAEKKRAEQSQSKTNISKSEPIVAESTKMVVGKTKVGKSLSPTLDPVRPEVVKPEDVKTRPREIEPRKNAPAKAEGNNSARKAEPKKLDLPLPVKARIAEKPQVANPQTKTVVSPPPKEVKPVAPVRLMPQPANSTPPRSTSNTPIPPKTTIPWDLKKTAPASPPNNTVAPKETASKPENTKNTKESTFPGNRQRPSDSFRDLPKDTKRDVKREITGKKTRDSKPQTVVEKTPTSEPEIPALKPEKNPVVIPTPAPPIKPQEKVMLKPAPATNLETPLAPKTTRATPPSTSRVEPGKPALEKTVVKEKTATKSATTTPPKNSPAPTTKHAPTAPAQPSSSSATERIKRNSSERQTERAELPVKAPVVSPAKTIPIPTTTVKSSTTPQQPSGPSLPPRDPGVIRAEKNPGKIPTKSVPTTQPVVPPKAAPKSVPNTPPAPSAKALDTKTSLDRRAPPQAPITDKTGVVDVKKNTVTPAPTKPPASPQPKAATTPQPKASVKPQTTRPDPAAVAILIAEARKLLAAKKIPQAKLVLEAALRINSNDEEAKKLLQQTK